MRRLNSSETEKAEREFDQILKLPQEAQSPDRTITEKGQKYEKCVTLRAFFNIQIFEIFV